MSGLRKESLSKACFGSFERFDIQKLRMDLVQFLRLLAQLCIYETTFLKQVYNMKDENVQSANSVLANIPEVKEIWK